LEKRTSQPRPAFHYHLRAGYLASQTDHRHGASTMGRISSLRELVQVLADGIAFYEQAA
jgi:hypothetical protein